MRINIGKKISENWSGKYSQNLLDHAKKSATNILKTATKKAIKETAEATGELIDNFTAEWFRDWFAVKMQKRKLVQSSTERNNCYLLR